MELPLWFLEDESVVDRAAAENGFVSVLDFFLVVGEKIGIEYECVKRDFLLYRTFGMVPEYIRNEAMIYK